MFSELFYVESLSSEGKLVTMVKNQGPVSICYNMLQYVAGTG